MATTTAVALTDREKRILLAYARGNDIDTITAQQFEDRNDVSQLLIRCCSLNRNTARELVRLGIRYVRTPDTEPTPPNRTRTRKTRAQTRTIQPRAGEPSPEQQPEPEPVAPAAVAVSYRAGVCDQCGARYIVPYQAGTITTCCRQPLRDTVHTIVEAVA